VTRQVLAVIAVLATAFVFSAEHQPKQVTEYLKPYIPEAVCLTWVQAKQKYGKLGMEFMINQRCE